MFPRSVIKISLSKKLIAIGFTLLALFVLSSFIESMVYPCGWCNYEIPMEGGGMACTLKYCPPFSSALLFLSIIVLAVALVAYFYESKGERRK
jgi:hypothetical protein